MNLDILFVKKLLTRKLQSHFSNACFGLLNIQLLYVKWNSFNGGDLFYLKNSYLVMLKSVPLP